LVIYFTGGYALFLYHPQLLIISQELLEQGAEVFVKNSNQAEKEAEVERDFLFRKVGQQQIEIDWFKKTLGISQERRNGR